MAVARASGPRLMCGHPPRLPAWSRGAELSSHTSRRSSPSTHRVINTIHRQLALLNLEPFCMSMNHTRVPVPTPEPCPAAHAQHLASGRRKAHTRPRPVLGPRAIRRARHTRHLARRRQPARSFWAPRRRASRVPADHVADPRHAARRPGLRHPRYRFPHALGRAGRRWQRTRGTTSLAATRANRGLDSRAPLTTAPSRWKTRADPALAIAKSTVSLWLGWSSPAANSPRLAASTK